MFRRDLLIDAKELVGEWCRSQVLFGDLSKNNALHLFGLRDVAKTSVQPVVAVRLNESASAEAKPKVVRLDLRCRLLRPDEVKQRGVESLGCELYELASKLSRRLPALTVRLSKVTADKTAATVSVESWAANDGMGRQIKAQSVIVAAGESSLDAIFRSMFKSFTMSAVVHDVEAEIDKLQLVRERHPAMQQVQVMEPENLDFVPGEFVDMELNKISVSSPNHLNQRMQVELKRCAMFHGFVIDPVDQLFLFSNSGQRVVARIANVSGCLRQAELQSFIHCDEDVLVLVSGLTLNLGDLESDLD